MDWAALQAEISAATGWPPSEVGALTLPRLSALRKAWRSAPPLPLLVARWVGIEPEQPAAPAFGAEEQAGFQEWMERELAAWQADGGGVTTQVVEAVERGRR